MILTDRFTMHPMQRQTFVQSGCPVYIHCSRRCTENRSGASFVQVRMVNCSERMICDVYLRIEGIDCTGKSSYVFDDVVLAECNAMPQAVFGENRLLFIGREMVETLRITVERVTFADGMIWRRLPCHNLVDTKNWQICSCGMPNPPSAISCKLCDRSFSREEALTPPQPIETISHVPIFERPAPIVRSPIAFSEPLPKENNSSQSTKVMLIILLLLLAVMVVGVLLYAQHENLLN